MIYLAYVYDLMQCNVIDLLWSTLERIRTCSVSHIDHPVPVGGQTGGEGDDSVLRRLTDGCGSAASVIFCVSELLDPGTCSTRAPIQVEGIYGASVKHERTYR